MCIRDRSKTAGDYIKGAVIGGIIGGGIGAAGGLALGGGGLTASLGIGGKIAFGAGTGGLIGMGMNVAQMCIRDSYLYL